MSQNCGLIVALCAICLGVVLSIAAAVMVSWAEAELDLGFTTLTESIGLYKVCHENAITHICEALEDPEAYVLTCRALINSANTAAIVETILGFYHLYKTSKTGQLSSKNLVRAIFGLGVIAVIFQVITAIVYSSHYEDDYGNVFQLGSAFFINNFSAAVLLFGSVLLFHQYRPDQVYPTAIVNTGVIVTTYTNPQPQPQPQPGYFYPYGQQQQPAMMQPQPQPPPPPPGAPVPGYTQAVSYPSQPVYPAYGMPPSPFATAASGYKTSGPSSAFPPHNPTRPNDTVNPSSES